MVKGRFKWLVLVALIGVLIVGSRTDLSPRQEATLSDGTRLQLMSTTEEPPHRFVLGTPMQRFFRAFLPPHGLEWLAGRTYERRDVEQGTRVVWFTVREDPSFSTALPNNQFQAVARGPDQSEVDISSDGMSFEQTDAAGVLRGKVLYALALRHYPRRSEAVDIAVFREQSTPIDRAAVFRVTNPVRRSYPVWKPEPMPVEAVNGELTCKLETFTTHAELSDPLLPASPRHRLHSATHVVAEVLQSGKRVSTWRPLFIRVSDPTGNVCSPDSTQLWRRFDGPLTQLSWSQDLFSEEPGFKVRLELAREPTGSFKPEELVHIPRVEVPDWHGIYQQSTGEFVVRGEPLHFYGLLQHGAHACAAFGLDGVETGTAVTLVEARDDRGRRLELAPELDSYYRHPERQRTTVELPFRLKGGEKTLDLTVAVQKTRSAEFIAAPVRPQ